VSTLLQREPEWIATRIVEHDAIRDALEAGDPEAADRALTAYLGRGKGSCASRCRRGLIVSRACGSNADQFAG
jgi:DNA-binding FadR family transcriptional regulator